MRLVVIEGGGGSCYGEGEIRREGVSGGGREW